MSDYDSEEEEAMAIPRDYDEEYQDSIRDESSSYFDAEAMAEDYARADLYFAGLRSLRQSPGYIPTGTPIRND